MPRSGFGVNEFVLRYFLLFRMLIHADKRRFFHQRDQGSFASNDLPHQHQHLAGFGVTAGLELGVDQLVSNRDLEPAAVRRDQGQAPDIILELFQQFIRQAHGPVGVVSYGAVDDLDVF